MGVHVRFLSDMEAKKERRDLILEFKLNQWVEGIIHEKKPMKQSFEEWLSDGTVLAKLMRTISFNSVEDEFGASYGCSDDIKKGRIRNLSVRLKSMESVRVSCSTKMVCC